MQSSFRGSLPEAVDVMSDFAPGTRVVVANAMGHLSGQTGVVIEMAEKLLNGHDCCVLLDRDSFPDGDKWPLCFYAHELQVTK